MKARQKRIILVLLALVLVGVASAMINKAIQSGTTYLYPPRDVHSGEAPVGKLIRLGGLVTEGSLKRSTDSLDLTFKLRDADNNEVLIRYNKILPDLFKEGKSAVVRGVLQDNKEFVAEEVLAKHDAEYMPKEVSDVMSSEHSRAVDKKSEQAGDAADSDNKPAY